MSVDPEVSDRVALDRRDPSPRDRLWRAGIRARNWLAAKNAWAPFEPLVLWAGPRLLPSSSTESVAELPGGLRLVLPPGFPAALSYRERTYEPALTAWFLRTARTGWTIVDGGANIGYYSLLSSRQVGARGRVFAFEPDPVNLDFLRRNLDSNRCDNVRAVGCALSSETGRVAFARDRFRAEGHIDRAKRDPAALSVDAVRLDDFLRAEGVDRVDLVKLDTEGGEVEALKGMETVARTSPELRVVLECNPRALRRGGHSVEDLFDVARSLGLARVRSVEHPSRELSLARPQDVAGFTQNLEFWR